jgi:GBP family porin
MKKTLVAVAALVAATGSFAQSSVTLYGVVDASLESVKGDKTLTRVSSDNLATSRLGFKGVEDLGGGLTAKFTLEHNVKADTGEQGNTVRFFDRAAWVGLGSTAYGELRLGRIDSSIGALAGNSAILGAQGYDDFKIAKTFSGDTYRRVDNAITYVLPTFVPGLTSQFQYSTATGASKTLGAEAADGAGKAYGLSAQYAAGPFAAGLGYFNGKENTAASKKDSAVLVFGSYDFGVAKAVAYFEQDKTTGAKETGKLYGVKAVVPVATNFSISAGVSKAKNTDKAVADDKDDATILAIKAVYDLSKRTSVYGLFTDVNNQAKASLAVGGVTAPTGGKDSHGLAFGIKHAF